MLVPVFSPPVVEEVSRLVGEGQLAWRATTQVVQPYRCRAVSRWGDTPYQAAAAALEAAESDFRSAEVLRLSLGLDP